MKRLFLLFLAMLMLAGCSDQVPEQTERILPANIRITALTEVTDFGGFTGGVPGGEAEQTRSMVETALSAYPAGLLEQLGSVEVLLAGELTGQGGFSGESYAGFTQRTGDIWRIVLDVTACHVGTVHHEMGHVLDSILTAAGRLPEEEWMELNPSGFRYDSGDWERFSDFFVDAYAMTNLTEDRAAVFEAAVMGGEGIFGGKSPLWLKLHTFCEGIRTHFDTEGWPAVTIWELALR